MAAYAALVSVMNIIEQLQVHPTPPISLDQKYVETLTEKVRFLQKFLEDYLNDGSQEAYELESRIRDAAHAVEDFIETEIVDQIHGGRQNMTTSSFDFYQPLQKVIKYMGLFMLEVMKKFKTKNDQSLDEVIGNMGPVMLEVLDKIKAKNDGVKVSTLNPHVGPSMLPPPSAAGDAMVGFNDLLFEIKDKLTGQQSKRQIIAIVGMGGIGKTTLARNVYVDSLIVYHFDICLWVTISQVYNVREILLKVLVSSNIPGGGQNLSGMSYEELGEKVYKQLSGRRYLIVMDDMWSEEVWDKLKFYFPDNNNGSGIMLTTRLFELASQLTGSHGLIEMNLLDDDTSWILFCKTAFGEEGGCPPELKKIGKKIASRCKGLPLSIAVIGGLLAKSKRTQRYLEHIAENLNAIVNLKDDERCLKILSMSYINLPVHLKPCFLYMGGFSEYEEIHVSRLIKLWVAEGFLKPIDGKCLEEVGRDYFKDLIDRNLILPYIRGSSTGRINFCTIHDLLRDLCLREARKEKFLFVLREDSPYGIITQRRIVVHPGTSVQGRLLRGLQSTSLARSLKCYFLGHLPPLTYCRLLRVLEENVLEIDGRIWDLVGGKKKHTNRDTILQLVNLRYISLYRTSSQNGLMSISPSPLSLFWNLQTLIIRGYYHSEYVAPSEIWGMPLLRHLKIPSIRLPNPPSSSIVIDSEGDDKPMFVFRYLHTLSRIINFKCDEDMISRIPNIKKLKVIYKGHDLPNPNNLDRLLKLESLDCEFRYMEEAPSINNFQEQNLTFPHSLRKLKLTGSCLDWEEMSSKVGSLPNLQVLHLGYNSCIGAWWKPVEGQFCSLKYLQIRLCEDLEEWNADETNFPCLEKLHLWFLRKLKEVPSGIGDISTLKSISIDECSQSSVISVKKIADEQAELGNLDIQVEVLVKKEDEMLKSLDSPNFRVR